MVGTLILHSNQVNALPTGSSAVNTIEKYYPVRLLFPDNYRCQKNLAYLLSRKGQCGGCAEFVLESRILGFMYYGRGNEKIIETLFEEHKWWKYRKRRIRGR